MCDASARFALHKGETEMLGALVPHQQLLAQQPPPATMTVHRSKSAAWK
jgi:hypothetical protein